MAAEQSPEELQGSGADWIWGDWPAAATELSPEEDTLRNIDGMLRAIDLINTEFTRRVQQDRLEWVIWHFGGLARIYQAGGWEKAEEYLERGRHAS
ncbi:hypothetical protein LCGC14_1968780 [marine sediment metagenome]|uniref:Uncharacterized protein n=1 Tax=marine sediment metagenome TaxID=412755 RepID=A0A0F9I9D2_9ZZZZ